MAGPRQQRSQTTLTRRRLLAAAALAGGLGRSATALAGVPARSVLELGSLTAGTTGPLRMPASFELAGVEWRGQPDAHVWLRVPGVVRWADAAAHHGGTEDGRSVGDPVWTGTARALELRADRALRGVRLHLIAAGGNPPPAHAAAALPVLDAGPGQPAIIGRAAWATPACRPRVPAGLGEIHFAVVHHTESLNDYSRAAAPALVRSICLFHRDVRGWHDIGYNFLIDRFGQVFEGRAGGIDEPVIGSQAGGFNTVSTGVALIGSFGAAGPPPAALRALENLLAWKLALHGVPADGTTSARVSESGAPYTRFRAGQTITVPRVCGHRDVDSTDCPGTRLYRRLPRVRSAVRRLAAGRSARLDLGVPGTPVTAGQPAPLNGRLALLDGTPLAGAPIEIQRREHGGERTLASTTTDPDGRFSAAVVLARNASLRALYRGDATQPAAVSPPGDIGVAVALTLSAAQSGPGAPVVLSGTVQPPVAAVRIGVAPSDGGSRSRLLIADGSSGSFSVALALAPGMWGAIARARASDENAPGASVPLAFSVA